MTVLITGASGFVGGALALRLANQGIPVRALVRTPAKAVFLQGKPGIQIVQGDFTGAERMREIAGGCETVYHIGAALSGNLETQQRGNILGTQVVAEAAAAAGVKRMLYMSTLGVYGYGPRLPAEVTEEQPFPPAADPYSLTKAQAEEALRRAAASSGLSYTIIRAGAIYGPRSKGWTSRAMQIARSRPMLFVGSGQGSLPLIFIGDLLELCQVAAAHPAAEAQAFNAVMDPPPTIRQCLEQHARLVGGRRWVGLPLAPAVGLARLLAAFAAKDSPLRSLPDILAGLVIYTCYSAAKARRLLGWQATTSLEEGVQKSVPWLREIGLLE